MPSTTQCARCRTGKVPPTRPEGLPLDGHLGGGKYDDTIYQPVRGMGSIVGLCLECLRLTCPDCAQEFRNAPGHCRARFGGCCRSFADKVPSQGSDPHRDEDGRCRSDADLLDRGWTVVDGHYWMRPGGAEARAKLAASRMGFADGGPSRAEVGE